MKVDKDALSKIEIKTEKLAVLRVVLDDLHSRTKAAEERCKDLNFDPEHINDSEFKAYSKLRLRHSYFLDLKKQLEKNI